MQTLDLSPYILDIYIQTEQIASPGTDWSDLEIHVTKLEQWWKRHAEVGDPLPGGMAYMMLAHINMLKGLIHEVCEADQRIGLLLTRIYRLKAHILEQFTKAQEIMERYALAHDFYDSFEKHKGEDFREGTDDDDE